MKNKKKKRRTWLVYLLRNTNNICTYIGATNNLYERLKAHNGYKNGGALHTRINKGNGIWKRAMSISNLTVGEALKLEKAAKKSRIKKKKSGESNLERRIRILYSLSKEYPHCNIFKPEYD